ncbi:formylglycine-generating enzyme family protein [Gemmata massiliana]|uniref:formylglycine-generating enzyme family protein n=1 Tax=Gemmata massiliana TaxID=1210884 RepID=UPI0018D5B50F|nr:formylglycine-generating enzyme family protein [Gemmata massiliana]
MAATLDADHAKDVLLPLFEHEPEDLRRVVLETIRSWRQACDLLVWLQEVARLPQSSRGLVPSVDQEDARLALHNLATQAAAPAAAGIAALKDYVGRAVSRLPGTAWADPSTGPVYRLLQKRCFPNGKLSSPGFDPAEHDRGPTALTFDIRQYGVELTFTPISPVAPNHSGGVGSLLGSLRTTNRILRVDDNWQKARAEGEVTRPIWADDFGQDQYGPWATIRVKSIVQRLRWIPAGRFRMGSPDSEEGRWDNEGPVHEVVISQGYWLFDTPCTQGLWEAVMSANPSRFKDPRRPVENVSWVDVGAFLKRANEKVAGLELTLPTEAQWEYACRAGTTTSTYTGDVMVVGRFNAPGLDAIAWYGGNSGREYDLEEGEDSSEWPNKQYLDARAGTRVVGSKLANGWGLYDMLGNVLEWCCDGQRPYVFGSVVDPVGSTEVDTDRVVRGSGWRNIAWCVRAAFRWAHAQDFRDDMHGFRCLISGEIEPARAQTAVSVRDRGAEPGPGMEMSGGAVAIMLSEARSDRFALSSALNVRIRSDLDDLILERSIQPRWATAIGRDRLGLWAEFEVRGNEHSVVTQRLRWIPAGRFRMGSPDSEEGRWDDEGPVHEVVISQGYWLFDTPCTQGLWEAVMSANPSRFKDPRRPVENVSWVDVGAFLKRANEKVAGLELTLPTEAQWEYACRAGTTTSTYTGDIEIVGENNAPGLDAIAWYGGNSGREYDLEEGEEMLSWTEKQYLDARAGTRVVGSKLANGWGLYDMLGNVWEWCRDGQRVYTGGSVADPIGPGEAGTDRVIRGGGWDGPARYARAAYRTAYAPSIRDGYLGFRCFSGQ